MRTIKFLAVTALLILSVLIAAKFAKPQKPEGNQASQTEASNKIEQAGKPTTKSSWISPVPNDRDPEYTYRSLKADEQGDHEFRGRAPISFFGRVVDQDDQPLAGASVEFSWSDLSAKGTSQAATSSDSAGRFELLDKTGKSLSVKVTKEGYYPYRDFSWNSYEFGSPFDRHFPDRTTPTLFRLKKQGKVEPLIAWRALLGVDNNGPERGFQFVPALITDPGDFRFSCKVGTTEDGRRRFDWEFKMGIPGGGLVATDEEFPFLAPKDGYTESVTWTAKIDDEKWQGVKRQMFYIRYGNPVRYGRLHVTFDGSTPRFYTRSGVILSWWINPSGSRVVESGKGEPPTIPEASLRSRTPWTGGL